MDTYENGFNLHLPPPERRCTQLPVRWTAPHSLPNSQILKREPVDGLLAVM